MKYELMKLPYEYQALEPWIDAKTMEIHHSKHHQTYIDKLNAALEKHPELFEKTPEELVSQLSALQVDEATRTAIKNHGGGVVNHNFFWSIMAPQKSIDEKLIEEIKTAFGSVEQFKAKFTDTALKQFGSGWAWLVRIPGDGMEIYGTANQDSPLSKGHAPLIAIDVWEHAYYLKYQNRRQEYIDSWWNVLKFL
jgi:Fe-Mn family superoxide dismutase